MERYWNAWLTITSEGGITVFECEHCGTGDYGWNWFAGAAGDHVVTNADLFIVAECVMDEYPEAHISGYLANDFIKWRMA